MSARWFGVLVEFVGPYGSPYAGDEPAEFNCNSKPTLALPQPLFDEIPVWGP